MNKDAYYFPHFSNARHDRKVKRIIKELGVEGYGIYFMLLEVLREQSEMTYPMDDIDLLADEFRTSEQKVRTVICNYKLFDVTPDERFFSPKLLEYLEPYFRMKEQRKLAGLKSGQARQRKALKQTKDEQPFNDRSTTDEQSKVKESKGKESKVNKINIDEKYIDIWNEWINYRREIKKPIKQVSEQKAYDNLIKLSGNSLEVAKQIIDRSIANSWQGLFELNHKPKTKNSMF